MVRQAHHAVAYDMIKKDKKTRIVVGLSGGVDSAVTAALLVRKGYEVIGVYLKNWNTASPTLGKRTLSADSYRLECPWYEDYLDAKRVALKLSIPFYLWDFREAYKKKVFDYFIDEIEKGRTPNPDIYCNSLIKFDDFQVRAIKELQADFVATGHYAKIIQKPIRQLADKNQNESKIQKFQTINREKQYDYALQIPKDTKKDQTYFLYRLSQEQLSKTLFPLADYTKEEVRALALEFDLPTKYKKDSQGICFVGPVEFRSFIAQWLAPIEGTIVNEDGLPIGQHKGAHLYTIGQKIGVDNSLVAKLYPKTKRDIPVFYVATKNIKNNTLLAVPGADNPALYQKEVIIEDLVAGGWSLASSRNFFARLRHTGTLAPVKKIEMVDERKAKIIFQEPQRAAVPGQHVVIYDPTGVALGGGVIADNYKNIPRNTAPLAPTTDKLPK